MPLDRLRQSERGPVYWPRRSGNPSVPADVQAARHRSRRGTFRPAASALAECCLICDRVDFGRSMTMTTAHHRYENGGFGLPTANQRRPPQTNELIRLNPTDPPEEEASTGRKAGRTALVGRPLLFRKGVIRLSLR